MNRMQRIAVILYCFLLAYCCLWVPWHVRLRSPSGAYERVGYGWVWAGPYRSAPIIYNPPENIGNGYTVLSAEDPRSSWEDITAEADLPLMGIRFLAATAVSAAAFLIAGLQKSSATRN